MEIIKIAIFLPIGIFVFVFLVLVRNTFIPRLKNFDSPKSFGMQYEDVYFSSRDKIRLSGWLIAKDKSQPWIIICHGLGANKSDVLEIANFLYKRNFNVFLFDFRAHGESAGFSTSFGYLESRDLSAAIDFLKSKEKHLFGLGVLGISMGASVAIMAAANNKDIKAVVLDSPYIDLDEAIIEHAKFLFPVFSRFFGKLAVFSYRIRFLVDSSQISPIKVISEISRRPVLIINGAEDNRMQADQALRLFQAAKEPKEIWLVPYAGHLASYLADKPQYEKRVGDFFEKHLR